MTSKEETRTRVVILTGSELRHQYFRHILALDPRLDVVASYCEGNEKSLTRRVADDPDATDLMRAHTQARAQSEHDFFGMATAIMGDHSRPIQIAKGDINSAHVSTQIQAVAPDVIVCYGTSIIKGALLQTPVGLFMNVHLGLSPYYRGSGTNVFPLIDNALDLVGATFMHIDEGIDTGKIIHQIRADYCVGDSVHSVGNRLIAKMCHVAADIAANHDALTDEPQPKGEGKLHKQADFDAEACEQLYAALTPFRVLAHNERRDAELPKIVQNAGLQGAH
ncbi:formyltransferase family protein [Loktanella sp. Alg231-35]|uniref:formyltransferase family protein n=1 Tax=Loktanella sp. Alg231-35 TaxID=1922220 RepID=UPI000D55B911|nr:formyltransferase family protein [Loktanella sp. Alg231-35]